MSNFVRLLSAPAFAFFACPANATVTDAPEAFCRDCPRQFLGVIVLSEPVRKARRKPRELVPVRRRRAAVGRPFERLVVADAVGNVKSGTPDAFTPKSTIWTSPSRSHLDLPWWMS